MSEQIDPVPSSYYCEVGKHTVPWAGDLYGGAWCAHCHRRFCSEHQGHKNLLAGSMMSCKDHLAEVHNEQDKQIAPLGEQSLQAVSSHHYYTKLGKPFKLGGRMVYWAMETLNHIGADMATTRRIIIDAETGWEIDMLDLGSHVVHNRPGEAYTIEQVVEAEGRKLLASTTYDEAQETPWDWGSDEDAEMG